MSDMLWSAQNVEFQGQGKAEEKDELSGIGAMVMAGGGNSSAIKLSCSIADELKSILWYE